MALSRTVEKTLKILELISNSPDGISLAQIYKKLNLPKATVYDILQTLYKEDAIYYKDQSLKTYVIGSKVFAISQAYTKNSHFINYSKDKLIEYANLHNITVFANKRVEHRGVIIYKHEPKDAKLTSMDVGASVSLYNSIVGKCFLAFIKPESYEEEMEYIHEHFLPNVDSFNKLKEEIELIRANGYAIDDGIETSYMCSYAVPVYNFENKIVGVLSGIRVRDNQTEEQIKEQLAGLIEIASFVSRKQGYKEGFYESIKF